MVKRLVDIDDALLTKAKEVLGLNTMKDTVNAALEEVVNRQKRLAFLDWLDDHADELEAMVADPNWRNEPIPDLAGVFDEDDA